MPKKKKGLSFGSVLAISVGVGASVGKSINKATKSSGPGGWADDIRRRRRQKRNGLFS